MPKDFIRQGICQEAAFMSAAAIYSLTVPAATSRVLLVFVVLGHQNREVVHFKVTENPSSKWAAQQVADFIAFDPRPVLQ
jgi:hypothetical protein